MIEAEICEIVLEQRSGYVKGHDFDSKPVSFSKSRCLSSKHQVELGRLNYLWRLNNSNLRSNKIELTN